jgi:uncharacterized protein YegL
MKKMHVSFILDETGSMDAIKTQTISGFNEYIDTLKKDATASNILFTLTKFNSAKTEIVYNAVKIADVPHLDNDTYCPAETTPLYDAIGKTIESLSKTVKGKKQSVLVIIQTDGQENASVEFTMRGIFQKIEEKKKLGWTFVFMGANQDAWATSQTLGISKGNTMGYSGVSGTTGAFGAVGVSGRVYANSGGKQTDNYFSDDDTVTVITK